MSPKGYVVSQLQRMSLISTTYSNPQIPNASNAMTGIGVCGVINNNKTKVPETQKYLLLKFY